MERRPRRHHAAASRGSLRRHLEPLRCVTEQDFVAAGKLEKRHTVDHLCMDEETSGRVVNVAAWERTRSDGLRLSDHSGVLVDLT